MNIGDRIRTKRIEKGMTLKELADKVGVRDSTIHKYESGMIPSVKYENIVKIAKALECTPIYLMGWEDENEYYMRLEQSRNLSIQQLVGDNAEENEFLIRMHECYEKLTEDGIKQLEQFAQFLLNSQVPAEA